MKIGRVNVWSDQHFPYVDKEAHEVIYKFSKAIKPEYELHIGDCLDLGGIGHHVESDYISQYEETVIDGLIGLGKHFNKLKRVNPKGKIVWIFGNHDDRLRRFVKKNPALKNIFDDPLALLKGFGNCTVTDEIDIIYLDDFSDDYSIGKMHFCHGFFACKHTASKHVEVYDESITFGHSHTMQMFTTVKRGSPRAGYCVGHLMTKEAARYLKGAPTRWVLGFGHMEYLIETGHFTMHLLPIVNGGFGYGGKWWH